MFVAWRALTYLKLTLFYIPELQRGKTKLKGKKRKNLTWLLVTEIEKVVQNSTLERGRTTYVWESRVPLCLNSDWTWAWVRPEHRTKHYCHRAATQPTAATQQFWKALENTPLPLQHFPSGSLSLQAQGRTLHPRVPTENFMLPAGHGEPGKRQGGSCTASMRFQQRSVEVHGQRGLVG